MQNRGWSSLGCRSSKSPANEKVELHLGALQREEEEKPDGVTFLKTEHMPERVAEEVEQARYKDLDLVEKAFRTSKTVEWEMLLSMRARKKSTRGHALVVILACRLVQELALRWIDLSSETGAPALLRLV